MAYQWRNGRLMSDEEIYHDDLGNWQAVVYGGAAIIPTVVLAYLGYRLGNKYTMLAGAAVGAWFAYTFYAVLVRIWLATLYLGIVLGMLAAFVYALRIFWNML